MIGLPNRPCGECAALVPVATGCPHWRPGIAAGRARERNEREERRREENRRRQRDARERAARDVAAFRQERAGAR